MGGGRGLERLRACHGGEESEFVAFVNVLEVGQNLVLAQRVGWLGVGMFWE